MHGVLAGRSAGRPGPLHAGGAGEADYEGRLYLRSTHAGWSIGSNSKSFALHCIVPSFTIFLVIRTTAVIFFYTFYLAGLIFY